MPLLKIQDRLISTLPQETILDSLIRAGLDFQFQCCEGYCGSCRTRLIGNVKYIRDPIAYKSPGEVLICCAIATSDLIFIPDNI